MQMQMPCPYGQKRNSSLCEAQFRTHIFTIERTSLCKVISQQSRQIFWHYLKFGHRTLKTRIPWIDMDVFLLEPLLVLRLSLFQNIDEMQWTLGLPKYFGSQRSKSTGDFGSKGDCSSILSTGKYRGSGHLVIICAQSKIGEPFAPKLPCGVWALWAKIFGQA